MRNRFVYGILATILILCCVLLFLCFKLNEESAVSIDYFPNAAVTNTPSGTSTFDQSTKGNQESCCVNGCNNKAAYVITGISGMKEYYCDAHYKEMNDAWENIISNTEQSKPKTTSNIFTNMYGTSTTICAHSGCSNYIASSGDTNCCPQHSNRCIECNCYIDEDAMFCINCISKAFGKR